MYAVCLVAARRRSEHSNALSLSAKKIINLEQSIKATLPVE
jgi:hypothetical protein